MSTNIYAEHPGIKACSSNLPSHVAVVMDGNGRWAKARQMSRTAGHRRGVEVARDIIFACTEKGIKSLTLFAFGVENWKRPSKEIRNLFRIFFLILRRDIRRLHEHNIQLKIIGDRSHFSPALQDAISQAEAQTIENTGLCLNVAINYSGRWDMLQAMNKAWHKMNNRDNAIDLETHFLAELSLAGQPDPDLFIRTGGVQRISNFMLWELAYTELYFTPIHWPDFTVADFEQALQNFARRERRFGLNSEQVEIGSEC